MYGLIDRLRIRYRRFLIEHPLLSEGTGFVAMCLTVGVAVLLVPIEIALGLAVPNNPLRPVIIWSGLAGAVFAAVVLVEQVAFKLGYATKFKELT